MDINIIYDDRHSEDYERLLGEFIRQGISKYRFWDAIAFPDDVVRSINASHKMIVRWAKENNKKEVVIAEQDLTFPSANGWKYFLEQKPASYDLYLACTYIPPVTNSKVCGFHLYVMQEKFYDKFLSIPDNVHVDTHMNNIEGDYHFCFPFAALQRPGFSANNKDLVNYNMVLSKEDIYQ